MKMESTINLSSVKSIPVYPGLQRHTKLFKPSSHVAPFIQGLSLQSSKFTSQFLPETQTIHLYYPYINNILPYITHFFFCISVLFVIPNNIYPCQIKQFYYLICLPYYTLWAF